MLQLTIAVIFLLTATTFLVLGEVRILGTSGSPNHLHRKSGTRIDVACASTDGSPVTWQHDGAAVESDDERSLIMSLTDDGSVSRLTILDARLNDSGLYRCQSERRSDDSDHLTISISPDDNLSDSFYTNRQFGVEIVQPPDSVLTVDADSTFTLRCVGHRGARLAWFHNGTRLTMTRQVIITSSLDISEGRQISLLTRNSVRHLAAGVYECRDLIRSDVGDNVTIQVNSPRKTRIPVEIVQPALKLNRVLVGSSIEIKCRANMTSELIWRFNDTQLPRHRYGSSVLVLSATDRVVQQDTSTLRVTNVTRSHSGKYSCHNLKDSEDTDYVMVTVDDDDNRDAGWNSERGGSPPMVPTTVVMKIGSVTKLQCSFQAPGDYRLDWTKDDQVLTDGLKYIILQDSKTISLGIRFTDRSDVGIYKCTFSHISRNKTAGVVIFNVTTASCHPLEPPQHGHLVRCPPQPVFGESCSFGCNHGYQINNSTPVVCERNQSGDTYWSEDVPKCTVNPMISDKDLVPTTVSNVLLRIRSSLKLQCTGSAVWKKHDQLIENNTKYTIETNSLMIRDTDRSDAGVYICSIYKDQKLIGTNKFNVTSMACPKHPPLPHGYVEGCSGEPVFGEICTFRCHTGYTLHGNRIRSCDLTGNETMPYWTGEQAECLGPAEHLFSHVSSATSSDIPAKLRIFENFVVFRLNQRRILAVVSSAILLLPHFLHW